MIKFCIICGKEFEGNSEMCPECQASGASVPVDKSLKNNVLIAKITEKITPKHIIIGIASLFVFIIALIIITAVYGNSQAAYNKYASQIFSIADKMDKAELDGAKAIDNNGTLYYGSNIAEHLSYGSYDMADSPGKIKSANETEFIQATDICAQYSNSIKQQVSKANKLSWLIVFDDNENVETVVCAKTNDSGKIGIYTNGQSEFSYSNINDFVADQAEQQTKVIEEHKQNLIKDAEINEKAARIEEYIVAHYRPDGIDKDAVYSNISEEYDDKQITAELSKNFDGYWIVRYSVDGGYGGQEGFCTVDYAENSTTPKVGQSVSVLPIRDEPDGLEGLLKDMKKECSLISLAEWEKQYSDDIEAIMQEKKKDSLRNQTFKGDRRLEDICGYSSDYKDEYERASESRLEIQSISVKMESGELVVELDVVSKVEYGRNWSVVVGYYDAAGERKGGCDCNMEYIPGQATSSGTFRGVPNCADHLKYYRVELIYDSK